MTVTVENLQKRIRLNPKQILNDIQKVLAYENLQDAELSIVLVNDRKMRALHKQYLGVNHPTDVLTFAVLPIASDFKKKLKGKEPSLRGEIVISTDTAVKQAKIFKTSAHFECRLYIIHGILHLLGFDDHKPEDIQRMRDKEAELMRLFLK